MRLIPVTGQSPRENETPPEVCKSGHWSGQLRRHTCGSEHRASSATATGHCRSSCSKFITSVFGRDSHRSLLAGPPTTHNLRCTEIAFSRDLAIGYGISIDSTLYKWCLRQIATGHSRSVHCTFCTESVRSVTRGKRYIRGYHHHHHNNNTITTPPLTITFSIKLSNFAHIMCLWHGYIYSTYTHQDKQHKHDICVAEYRPLNTEK